MLQLQSAIIPNLKPQNLKPLKPQKSPLNPQALQHRRRWKSGWVWSVRSFSSTAQLMPFGLGMGACKHSLIIRGPLLGVLNARITFGRCSLGPPIYGSPAYGNSRSTQRAKPPSCCRSIQGFRRKKLPFDGFPNHLPHRLHPLSASGPCLIRLRRNVGWFRRNLKGG